MPVYAVDDQPTMAEDPDGDVEVPEVQQFSVDEQPLPPPADPTEAELHRSTQEVCERLMKVSKDAIDKAVANRPKHIQDLIDAPYEPNPICQVSDEELAEILIDLFYRDQCLDNPMVSTVNIISLRLKVN